MFATLGRTWELTKQSFAVLKADKEILLFPVMSGIVAILVAATFFFPVFATGLLTQWSEGSGRAAMWVWIFLYYFASYFVIIFFNSAVVACANIRLSGGDPTVGDGLRVASSRLSRILMWTLVAATVGLILNALRDQRNNFLYRLAIGFLGAAWTMITYFMIPVVVFEDLSIGASIKRSAEIFRKNWGEEVASGLGFGLLGFLLMIPGIIIAFVAFTIHPAVGVVVSLAYFLTLAAVLSAVKSIFTVVLYRYATKGEVPQGFSRELVQGAFMAR